MTHPEQTHHDQLYVDAATHHSLLLTQPDEPLVQQPEDDTCDSDQQVLKHVNSDFQIFP